MIPGQIPEERRSSDRRGDVPAESPLCRSADCQSRADYLAIIPTRLYAPIEKGRERHKMYETKFWRGKFCHRHLIRVLDRKLIEMGYADRMTLRKL
jgi:hypothetical protein